MIESAAPIDIRLFGAPEVVIRGDPLQLKSQNARALLFYLTLSGQPHTRSHLATLLWSESPAAKANGSLRAALFQLRRALRSVDLPDTVVAEADLLSIRMADIACDVHHFRHLLTAGGAAALTAAVALYRGPLLQGFSLPNAPLFDEWLRGEDEPLRQACLGALIHLASAGNDEERALVYLQRALRLDPLAETAQQALIQLYLDRGAVSDGLRQYHEFESELRQQMGVVPAPATRALFQEALRRQQAEAAPTTLARSGARRRPQPRLPFVGRDGLLAAMKTISQAVTAGHGQTILIQGDGGIGKTRLLQEFLHSLNTAGTNWLVLQGACSPFDDLISYGPFLEAFQDTPLGDLTGRLLTLAADAPAARDQFTYRILQTLRQISQSAPLVLAIDDLHWANSSTLNLFGLLATRMGDLPVLLVGTVQRSEAIPALQRLVTMERRRGRLQLLSLPPLTDAAVDLLLQRLALTPGTVTSLAGWLQELADGNPFVLDEIIAQLRAEGILTAVGDQWQLDPGHWLRWRAAYRLPETTYDLVAWRLRNLAPAAHQLLEVLAVAGEPLPYALLADFAVVPAGELLGLLDDLLARGLLVERDGERFGLAHHLLRETELQRLSQVRRRLLHRRLAHLLTECAAVRVNFPLWEIARHAVAGEDVELARQYGLQILPKLPRDFTGAVTVDFLHHLHDLLAASAAPDEQLRVARVIADVHQSLGHLVESALWQQRYLELARATDNVSAQAAAYLEQGELALISNDYIRATTAAEAGLAACAQLARADPAFDRLTGRGHRLLGHALAMEGRDLTAAEEHLQLAAAVHRRAANFRDLCASLFELGNVAAQRGKLAPALAFYAEAAEVAEAGQAHYFHALARNNLAYHNLLLGRLTAANAALAQGQDLAEKHELLGALLHLSSTQGEIHLYLAEWAAATEAFQRGLTLAEELQNLERQAGNRAGLALAARGNGEFALAEALLAEALLLISPHGFWHLRARLHIWQAETHLRAGQQAAARAALDAVLATAQTQNRALLRLQAERLHAVLLAHDGDWFGARELFDGLVDRAMELSLPLEVARCRAAWGGLLLQYERELDLARTLLAAAHQTFVRLNARADQRQLPVIQSI